MAERRPQAARWARDSCHAMAFTWRTPAHSQYTADGTVGGRELKGALAPPSRLGPCSPRLGAPAICPSASPLEEVGQPTQLPVGEEAKVRKTPPVQPQRQGVHAREALAQAVAIRAKRRPEGVAGHAAHTRRGRPLHPVRGPPHTCLLAATTPPARGHPFLPHGPRWRSPDRGGT